MSDALQHYENFPVASWLCPAHLRAPIAAIYRFARTADDIADEGDAPAPIRLHELASLRADLMAVAAGGPAGEQWRTVFDPLGAMITKFQLPVNLLNDLLTAFEQDVIKTRDGAGYPSRAELLDYCRRSANPVGRLLLHLYNISDAASLSQSDDICTALQLINFWQDLSVDLPRGRYYLPNDDCERHGVRQEDLLALRSTREATSLIAEHTGFARAMMLRGAPLAKSIPGRAGWELRLVVQGGLRILDKIEALNFATLNARPKITKWDAPLMLLRAARM